MTSVGSTPSSRTASSPLDRLKNELSDEVQAGTIKSGDKDALSGALDSIDASLKADRQSQAAGTRPDPAQFTSKLESLINQQVDKGTLTSDQASELKTLFKNAKPSHGGDHGGPGGPGGPGGAGGPPPGPPPAKAETQDSSTSDDTSSTNASSTSSTSKLLSQFLAGLQSQQDESQTYGSTGASAGTPAASNSLLVNFQV